MARNGNYLPPNMHLALSALLQEPTIAAAAQAAGVGHRTLTRWLAEDADFQTALRESQQQAMGHAISRLAGHAATAAGTLATIASDDTVPPAVRVQAASKVLSELRQGIQYVALSGELAELKRVVDEISKRT
ncbi:MAG: hypothetical protein KDE09_11305 [Anaerolineales bacterium]|nr:hypothetical protein [Anaerolineales bacterium]